MLLPQRNVSKRCRRIGKHCRCWSDCSFMISSSLIWACTHLVFLDPRRQRALDSQNYVWDSLMDGWVRVLRPFNSISVISRRWKGEHERLCSMKCCLGLGRISPPAGFEPTTPWSEVGSANRSATQTLLGLPEKQNFCIQRDPQSKNRIWIQNDGLWWKRCY